MKRIMLDNRKNIQYRMENRLRTIFSTISTEFYHYILIENEHMFASNWMVMKHYYICVERDNTFII